MTTRDEELKIVAAFHDRLNARDSDKLLELAADDIRIGGPRGSGVDKDLLYEWVGRANVIMTPRRILARDGIVVVEQFGVWKSAATGAVTGSKTVASVFRFADGKIVGLARYGSFGEAATKAGLDEDDEVRGK